MTVAAGQPLGIAVEPRPPAVVVRLAGTLDLASYPEVRDTLLRCSAEEPAGIVVDLSGLDTETAPVLSVFTTVWMRISEWPGTPLLLAGPTSRITELLHRTGVSRFIAIFPDLDRALTVLRAPPHRHRLLVRLPRTVRGPARARRAVERACREWGLEPLSENARLVASELVSNAWRHAGAATELRLEWAGGRLTVAVRDHSRYPPRVLDPPPTAPGGHGMRLVAQLASCWGFTPTAAGGKVVWASLRLPGAGLHR